MQDFPPRVRAYLEDGGPSGPPRPGGSASIDAVHAPDALDTPDTRSTWTFLRWLVRQQGSIVVVSLVVALVWTIPQALGPWVVGRAIDTGITPGDASATTYWVLVLLVITVVGALSGIVYHTLIVRQWLIALYGTTLLVTRKTVQLGHVSSRRVPAGEVLSVSGSDSDQFGAFFEVGSRAVSQLVGYLVVAVIVLTASVRVGVLVLLAAPLLVLLGAPLLRPLQRWQGIERSRSSDLTSRATDIVAGLRILRGIGGEDTFGDGYARQSQSVRRAGVTAGWWQAAVEALGVLLSGGFVVALMWVGVREVVAARLSIGQLVSFLGYGLFLIQPMRTFVEFAQKLTRTLVSAAKAIAVLDQRPPWRPPEQPRDLPHHAVILDEESGVRIEPGRLTMVVSSAPDVSAALADRLGRFLTSTPDAVITAEVPEGLKGRAARDDRTERAQARARQARLDEERAVARWGVSVGGVDLSQVPLAQVRERIVVSDTAPYVFAGTLREAVDPHHRATREQAERALHAAAAEDVFDGLPGGWQGVLEERGRGLSGGQRQRLVLSRLLVDDPEVLVLVEPTSAVDAHTEARIAERLGTHRAGRTTVVMTASPLLLHHADEIVLLEDGRATLRGRHAQLLATSPAYRAVVVRGDPEGDLDADPDDRDLLEAAADSPDLHDLQVRP